MNSVTAFKAISSRKAPAEATIKMEFIKEEDVKIEETFIVKQEDPEEQTGKETTSIQIKVNVVRGLLEEYSTCPSAGGCPALETPLRLTDRHFPSLVPQTVSQGSRTRRHCKVCLSGTRKDKQRRLTKYMCMQCNAPLCVVPCFEEYHTLKHY